MCILQLGIQSRNQVLRYYSYHMCMKVRLGEGGGAGFYSYRNVCPIIVINEITWP